jgi:hypothetical protein
MSFLLEGGLRRVMNLKIKIRDQNSKQEIE